MKRSRLFAIFAALFCITMNANSQHPIKNYDSAWKKVEGFVKKDLPASALAEVKKIYAQAKKDKQEAQVIKALTYIPSLQEETREDNAVLSIAELEKEINTATGVSKALLHSLAANAYWQYFQQNRWQIYNRTETQDFKKDDIRTWSTQDLFEKTSSHYLSSIENKSLLQKTSLAPYDVIIAKGNVRHLRPTLYDLLAFQALEYFQSNERDLSKPAYAFEIDQAAAFDPAADFIYRKFITKDTGSLHYQALLIYQQLLAFHLNDKEPGALIDADIKRYEFVRNYSVHPDKEQQYFYGINHIAHQYGELPAATQAWYLVAEFYSRQADQYSPYGDTTNRYKKVQAKEIAEKLVARRDSSEGKMNAISLLRGINYKELQFNIEQVNLPGKPFRALVSYRNMPQVYLRIVKLNATLKKAAQNLYDEKNLNAIIDADAVRSWTQAIPETNDFLRHNAEIKIDAIPHGEYVLIASSDKSFAKKTSFLAAASFYVSGISYINNDVDFFVLDRDSGQPLKGANVTVWDQAVYDYSTGRYAQQEKSSHITDQNGFFRIERDKSSTKRKRSAYGAYTLEISTKGDYLFLNKNQQNYYFSEPEQKKETTRIFLFKDRGIYRPGQTVYFKGIVLAKSENEKTARILPGFSTVIRLHNMNGDIVDSLKVTVNEYGSFSGKFQLPLTGPTGELAISSENQEVYETIRVEEYKRPKFYVEHDPLKGAYRINDLIKITGTAKAYAGNNIDGAQVKYRVMRQGRFLYPWFAGRIAYPSSTSQEIAHGETTTDKDGKFSLTFTAIPDLKMDPKFDPAFDYIIYTDITDINGETRSAEQTLSVSYKSLRLNVNIPETLPADSLGKVFIRTENNNGEFEPAQVTVKIWRLKEEKRLIRTRLWERPDQFLLTRDEYLRYFPNDEYDNESDPSDWPRETMVLTRTDSSKTDGQFMLEGMLAESGVFAIEIATADKDGKEVKDLRYVRLFNPRASRLEQPRYLKIAGDLMLEPGQNGNIEISSSADNLFVIQRTDKRYVTNDTNNVKYSFIKLNDEKKNISFAAADPDRGGYGASWSFVKHNEFFSNSAVIKVPWSNKRLTIDYASFRDKTLPGSKEQWKLKISGTANEKLAAEVLASMYDASLDQFVPETWQQPAIWPVFAMGRAWQTGDNFVRLYSSRRIPTDRFPDNGQLLKTYDRLIFNQYTDQIFYSRSNSRVMRAAMPAAAPGIAMEEKAMLNGYDGTVAVADTTAIAAGTQRKEERANPTGENNNGQPRRNFNETAFFFPDLKTDSSGTIEFSFTIPEALTKWKFQALAHTKELAFGYTSKEVITQKDLMVQPNAPRFLREGDQLVFNAKIVNLSDKELNGNAELQLFNASTNQPVDILFNLTEKNRSFKVAAGQSTVVFFPLSIPSSYTDALTWRVIAKADNFSDGEENVLPVLSNRMLVTETISLPMRGNGTKNFSFDKLKQSGNSKTLQHRSLTVEYTSNPVWYAVQSLPYLMEYPYDCAEQTWNRYYANSLAASIANSTPKLKQLFDRWKTTDTAALMSNLQKNQELKSILLEETPWVLEAKTAAQQKQNLALLFDMLRMTSELNGAYEKLKQLQSSNGGFVWFSGGPDDRYMTQYIITGIGHLMKLKGIAAGQDAKLKQILEKALPYLDRKLKEDYDNLVKYKTDLKRYVPSYNEIQYFYMRSFFPEYKVNSASVTAYNYFKSRLPVEWTRQNKYMQGMTALALHRLGDKTTPAAILKSLKETSINNEELGMYWKDASRGWWWYESPIERQALLIEAFSDISNDTKSINDLRTWLLKNKQTNKWESTKATAEACYALLLQGTSWTNEEPLVSIKLGGTDLSSADNKQEAGTGYFSKTFDAGEVKPDMGNIAVTVSSADPTVSSWGGVYWQYFENLDKITTAATPLQLQKKLFIETNADRGAVLTPVKDGAKLKVGDKIKVRIELRTDRDMEYVHMKDMRASAFEPVNVLSSYKWQDGLGYYESTRDASTNFFFDRLRKGTYVFEYTLFVTHAGNFSNGVTTIQCMYAPEFSAHSEGIRVSVQ